MAPSFQRSRFLDDLILASVEGRRLTGAGPAELSVDDLRSLTQAHSLSWLPHLAADPAAFPAELLPWARAQYERALIARDYCLLRLSQLRPVLCDSGRAVLLQGAALWDSVYPDTMPRTCGDIDILLPDGNARKVAAALCAAGFRPQTSSPLTLTDGTIALDLHDSPWGIDHFPHRQLLGLPEIVETSPSRIAPGFLAPGPSTLALHTAFHALKHAFSRKIWDLDLLLLYRQGMLAPASLPGGVRGIMAAALRHLAEARLIDPRDPLLQTLPRIRPSLVNAAARLAWRSGSGELALALTCPGIRRASVYAVRSFVPARSVLKTMYGDRAYPVLMFMRARTICGLGKKAAFG